MYSNDQKLEWAGLAKIAGGSIIYGLNSLDTGNWISNIAQQFGDPGVVSGLLSITGITSNLNAVETQWMKMAYDVYHDLSWQFLAYETGGINEIERLAARGETP
jgi:hypothetical protein